MPKKKPVPASTSEPKKARVAVYVRVSTDKQAERGESLETQRTQLTYYAVNMLGSAPEDVTIFEDAGYSGKNTDRPEYQRMMSQVRAGAFTHMLVYKIDRVSRNLLDFSMMYSELQKLGVSFVSKTENFDTSTAMGEAMLKIILVFAELERKMTSERVRHTMIGMAQSGHWNGGRVPYGYSYRSEGDKKDVQVFQIVEDEAAVVRLIFTLYEDQQSIVWIAKHLNSKGLRSRAGSEWSPASVSIILHNVFYVGDYRYNVLQEGDRMRPKPETEWVTVRDHHAPLVSREQFSRVQAILHSNRRMYREVGSAFRNIHVFGGLMFCGNCGHMLYSIKSQKKAGEWHYSYYPCPTRRKSHDQCSGRSTSDPVVGEFVFNYILNMLNAQRDFASVGSPSELQERLLFGDTFRAVDHIEPEDVEGYYSLLASGSVSTAIYARDIAVTPAKRSAVDPEVSRLRKEKRRLERALDRLLSVYLYSESSMSEAEYVAQQNVLRSQLAQVNDDLGIVKADAPFDFLSDNDLLVRASEFILAQKLSGRSYVNYARLASTVEPGVLKTFVQSIIDHITIYDGRVKTIIFRNGLAANFVYREK